MTKMITLSAMSALSAIAFAAPTEGKADGTAAGKNFFDFADTSDLPEDVAKRLTAPSATNSTAIKEYADIIVAGYNDGGLKSMSIAQVIAVAHRMGKTPPSDQTVRGYLNKAVEAGFIAKPTRQTYGPIVKAGRTKAEAAGLSDLDAVTTSEVSGEDQTSEAQEADNDPLAGIL